MKPQELIGKYNSGPLTQEEERLLESYIEQGLVDLDSLQDIQEMDNRVTQFFQDQLHKEAKIHFYKWLKMESLKTAQASSYWYYRLWRPMQWQVSLLPMMFILLAGIAIGFGLQRTKPTEELLETQLLSRLKHESAKDRLQAVHLTKGAEEVSDQVADALLFTLNFDPNSNVRLATLEALYPYVQNPKVRAGLIQSIQNQDAPIVQIALAEMMIALGEKQSIEKLQHWLDDQKTPEEVKAKIRKSITRLL